MNIQYYDDNYEFFDIVFDDVFMNFIHVIYLPIHINYGIWFHDHRLIGVGHKLKGASLDIECFTKNAFSFQNKILIYRDERSGIVKSISSWKLNERKNKWVKTKDKYLKW